MFQRNGPSAGAEEAERLDLEKPARLEAGLRHSARANRRASTPGKPIVLAGDQDDVQVDQVGGFSSLAG